MANKAITATFFLVLFLVAGFEVATVKGQVCSKPSATFSGYCGSSDACNHQCTTVEAANGGGCQWSGWLRVCMCYYRPSCPSAQMQKEFIEAAKKANEATAKPKPQLKN